jgi:protein ImuA
MDLAKLTRQSHRTARPGLRLFEPPGGHPHGFDPAGGRPYESELVGGRPQEFHLAGARAHEACGSARRRLALWLAGQHDWPVLWIRPDWHPDRLHMAGVRAEIDPGRLIFVECCRPADLLWSMEEALRSGLIRLVVADLPDPPGLTPVRRLHLAAEAGYDRTGRAPVGLLLTPGDGGAAGVDTRWRLRPAHEDPDTPRWHLSRLRARDAAPGDWTVTRDAKGRSRLATETATRGVTQSPELHPT